MLLLLGLGHLHKTLSPHHAVLVPEVCSHFWELGLDSDLELETQEHAYEGLAPWICHAPEALVLALTQYHPCSASSKSPTTLECGSQAPDTKLVPSQTEPCQVWPIYAHLKEAAVI